jgi:hypothetical protein
MKIPLGHLKQFVESWQQSLHKISMLIAFLLCFQTGFSQENFVPGFVIQLNGDTVKGSIDYRGWVYNPTSVTFRDDSTNILFHLELGEIRGFGTANDIYESAIFEIETNTDEISNLKYSPDFTLKTRKGFLQVLIQGPKKLYYYYPKFGKKQYFIKQDSSIQLLMYKKYFKVVNNETVSMENNRFLGQLIIYLQDCPEIRNKISEIRYTEKSLMNLFHQYYECSQQVKKFTKKPEKQKLTYGVLAGTSTTFFRFIDYESLKKTKYPASTKPTFGLTQEVVFPKKLGKWSILNELLFTSFKTSASYTENYWLYTKTTFSSIELFYLKLNSLFCFKYSQDDVSFYHSLGISLGFPINSLTYIREEFANNDTLEVYPASAFLKIRNPEAGYILGLGLNYQKFFFEGRYEAGNGISKLTSIRSRTTRIHCLVGFRF